MNESTQTKGTRWREVRSCFAVVAVTAVLFAPIALSHSTAGAAYNDKPFTGPTFCKTYGANVGPQIVIGGVSTNIYECGGSTKDLSAMASPYTDGNTPFDYNGPGTDPHGSFQCVELSLRFEYVVYKKDTLFLDTGYNLPGGAGANVVYYLHKQFGVKVGFGDGSISVPPTSAPAPVAGNILSLGPERSDEPTGHTAVIVSVKGSPATENYVVTILSENAPTLSTIDVVNGRWADHWGYDEYNWTRQSGDVSGAPVLGITTPSSSSSPPNATVGNAYSFQFKAGGVPGPYSWSIASGALPPGLTLSPTGLVSGTPTAISERGPFTLEVAADSQNDEAPFTIWALRGKKRAPPIAASTCWGRCGGPDGPVGGYFAVSGGKVQDFEDTQACLGARSDGFTYYLEIEKALPVSSKGTFTYSGPASVWNGMGRTGTSVWVTLVGDLYEPKQTSVILVIAYGVCGTVNLTIKDLSN